MENVTLQMTDQITGKTVERTICAINAYSSGEVCWELQSEERQRKNLERWIEERGNQQHATTLKLESWEFN